jgi:hypothetical protein
MKEATIAYEPPAMVEVGDFSEVTLGHPYDGFERWDCLFNCY